MPWSNLPKAIFNKIQQEQTDNQRPFWRKQPATRKLTNLYSLPTVSCKTTSKYKQNILKHLKSYSQVNINRAAVKENLQQDMEKKSTRDRHIQSVHHDDNVDDNDVDDDLIIEDEDFPSMAFNNLSNAMSPPLPAALPVPSTAIVTVLPSNAMSAPPVSPTATITVPPSAPPPATLSVPSTAMLSNEISTPTPDARCSICVIDRHHHRVISHSPWQTFFQRFRRTNTWWFDSFWSSNFAFVIFQEIPFGVF